MGHMLAAVVSVELTICPLDGSARRADAVDLGAAADTIGEKVLCNADCVAKLESSQKASEHFPSSKACAQTCPIIGQCRRSHRLVMVPPPQVTTKSGLQYVDIMTGKGPNPQSGYQVCEPCSHYLLHAQCISPRLQSTVCLLFAMKLQSTGRRTGAAEHEYALSRQSGV